MAFDIDRAYYSSRGSARCIRIAAPVVVGDWVLDTDEERGAGPHTPERDT